MITKIDLSFNSKPFQLIYLESNSEYYCSGVEEGKFKVARNYLEIGEDSFMHFLGGGEWWAGGC